MTRGWATRRMLSVWFAVGFAAASLVTCARCCRADPDPVAVQLRSVAARHVAFLAESSR